MKGREITEIEKLAKAIIFSLGELEGTHFMSDSISEVAARSGEIFQTTYKKEFKL